MAVLSIETTYEYMRTCSIIHSLIADTERALDVAHEHAHSHAPANLGRAFAMGITLILGFVIAEFLYGRAAHSVLGRNTLH